MKIKEIRELQRELGYAPMQRIIDNGSAWYLEGSTGRLAMSLLEMGACFLPKKSFKGPYGNLIPSRDMLQAGSKGTLENTINYYERITI